MSEKNKMDQKNTEQSILADIPTHLPALTHAVKIQKRCAKVGFDWQSLKPVVDKIYEEIDEVMEEALMVTQDQTRIEEEIGDLLFAVTNLARHLNCNPEAALAKANNKFVHRFMQVEKHVANANKPIEQHSLDELENFWQQVKQHE